MWVITHKSSWSIRNPGLDFLCRWLAPRSFASRGRSYAQTVMAGGSVTMTGGCGVGGGDQRRGRNMAANSMLPAAEDDHLDQFKIFF